MLSKVCASWLVVLLLLPFTAPFWTFDLNAVLSGQSARALGTPSSTTSTAGLTRAVLSPFLRLGRLRLALARVRVRHAVAIAAAKRSGAFPNRIVHPPGRPTVLRI
jgi:hypothetical protein